MTPGRMKKIFISDIHLGDERSFAPHYPYGWIRSNISNLANFLEEQLNNPDVAEIVILGDLFDTWVIPTNLDPLASFVNICGNQANSPIIEALKKLAGKGILSYVPGNHDMAFSGADLAEAKQFMASVFPGIRYSCDPDLPVGVYRSGKIVAEHGNRYCLFNAPDTWTNQPSFLPLGYFISRLVAYKVSKTGTNEDFHDILKIFIQQYWESQNFIRDIFIAVAANATLNTDDPINMTGTSGFPPTVGDIGTFYEGLIENWGQNHPDISWRSAALNDGLGDLSQAAIKAYFSTLGSDQNIIIFGHTHRAVLKSDILEPAPGGPDKLVDLPCPAIYANCGTWVDSVESTYVETQEDADTGRHHVRLWTYPDKTLRGEAFVEL
ncbi:MAG: metallophosphoesterase [Desulfobacterales bacterium]|nr:metallophosphoesterase [Desulfobacterales bacterium]